MRIKHLVKVHFDRRKSELTQEWFDRRYQFFFANTLKSLESQTFKEWDLWISFGCNMDEIHIAGLRLPMLWFHQKTGRQVLCSFRNDHNPTQLVTNFVADSDYVYVTRIDSDDLYAPDAIQLANGCTPLNGGVVGASMFRRGYLHDVKTKETGVYKGDSTPFHTMMIPTETFCDPMKYKAIDYGDHSLVNSRYPTQVLPDWRFTVLVHGDNFISDMSYGREKLFNVENSWSVERFLKQPVVFDVDDFCDRWNCLPELDKLKEQYPNFRCTLFTIPCKIGVEVLRQVILRRDWVELAIHGVEHEPNEELKSMSLETFHSEMKITLDDSGEFYVKGFRPPGWYITADHIRVLNDFGMWVAIHKRDERTLGPLCKYGYYVCGDRPYWHGHTSGEGQRAHSVCGNGIRECLPELLTKWPRDQAFSFVSDAVGVIK